MRTSSVVQLAVSGIVSFSSLLACDCFAPPLSTQLRNSAAVFTGKVVEKKELASRKDGRRRYEVHFAVSRQWKGPKSSQLIIYDAQPEGDCQGWGFRAGKQYLVFVRRRAITADIVQRISDQDITITDIWNDVVPIGKNILVGEICSGTEEIKTSRARETIRLLGQPHYSF